MNLPNRKQRRKLAKDLGLFKDRNKNSGTRAKEVGKMINLRNLTEQRNQQRNQQKNREE